jgi:hypothetical protein
MSHTVSGKLFKAPFIKAGCGKDGQSTMFAFKLSEKTKDFKTGQDVYANYDAVIYAQSQGQIDFYTQATAEGSFVVVSCEKLAPKISDCGKYVNLNMENARLENANYGTSGAPQQQSAPIQQQAPPQQQAPQMAPAYQPAPQQQQSWGNAPQQQAHQQQAPIQGYPQQVPGK